MAWKTDEPTSYQDALDDLGGSGPRCIKDESDLEALVDEMAGMDQDPAESMVVLVPRELRLKRMRASVLETARQIQEQTSTSGFRYYVAMITLTYRDDVFHNKDQIKEFMRHVRRWMQRRGIKIPEYLWVQELTKRSRPHYHILIWLPHGIRLPKPDDQGWWKWGSTKIEQVRNALGYLVKYTSKAVQPGTEELAIAKHARLYGNGGLDAQRRRVRRWRLFPKWVRDEFTFEDDPMRAPFGGGYVSRLTDRHVPSPYELFAYEKGWGWIMFKLKDEYA